ncbi:MAG: hypothetical protein GY772_26095 [bacterium]|nr:hypothetical protein [bacterium]
MVPACLKERSLPIGVVEQGEGDWIITVDGKTISSDLTRALALEPQFTATAHNRDLVFNEPGFLASTRLTLKGHRHVLMARVVDVLAAADGRGGGAPGDSRGGGAPGDGGVGFQEWVWNTFGQMSREALSAFSTTYELVSCTAGPGDILYMPAGWVSAEQSRGEVVAADADPQTERSQKTGAGTHSDVAVLKVAVLHAEHAAVRTILNRLPVQGTAGTATLSKEDCASIQEWLAKAAKAAGSTEAKQKIEG